MSARRTAISNDLFTEDQRAQKADSIGGPLQKVTIRRD